MINPEMATLQELRNERLRKLQELKDLGVNPYPAHTTRTHILSQITADFTKLEGQRVSVVGRITNIRKFGKIAFVVIRDASGSLQLFLSANVVHPLESAQSQLGFEQLPLLDSGDFIEATGEVIKTKTDEISVAVSNLRLLSKSLRPLPTTHDGFTNKEERLRRRYVDLNVNQDVYERFIRRSNFWKATREFFDNEGFIEVNTPVLEHTTGGADANPFVTHMDALDQDFYLRISHELPLKRLLVGGYEKVYDIGPRFRNENYSDEHLPEHINMEWYWAYADWNKGMELTERNFRFLADKTWGKRQFDLPNGMHIDLGTDGESWPRVSFIEVIQEHYGIDVFESSLEDCQAALKQAGLVVEDADNRSRIIDKLWKKIRVTLSGPVFLVDTPAFLQPLAKVQMDDPRLSQQFNLVLGGTEVCKAYSELNNPLMQLANFEDQQNMRDAGDKEAMMMDIDYVEALEYGMPPACGLGYGERLFWLLEGVSAREGVIFPQLRREVDEVTKTIYPELAY
jgi:lysyl-tRNA synthetase class 2